MYSEEDLALIRSYHESVDDEVVCFLEKVYQGQNASPVTVGFLTTKAAEDIERLTGKKVSGNRIVLDDNGAWHIKKRHGQMGEHDESMKDVKDIARIGYVLANYDSIEFRGEYAQGYVDANGKLAPKVIIKKRIDGTFYVIEAVSDAKKKRNYVVSAYIN